MTMRRILMLAAIVALLFGAASAWAQDNFPPPPSALPVAPGANETNVPSLIENAFAGPAWGGNRQLWLSADFSLGFMRGANFPTLATTADAGTPRNIAGLPGAQGTSLLFNGFQFEDIRAGFRIGAGYWFDGESNLGIEAGVVYLGGQSNNLFASSDQFPIIGRPYFDANNGTQQATLVAFPGLSTGTLDIQASSGSFTSGHFDFAEKALDEGWYRLIALAGYRFYRYDEALNIRQTLVVTDPNFIPGTNSVTNDSFTTRNEFHGFDMGFRNQFVWDRFSLEILTKVAIGDVRRVVNINGDQTVTVPGVGTAVSPGGLLALDSNNGSYHSHDWKVLPEFGASLDWRLRPNLNVRLGYSFLLLNGIARASDQIDQTLNPNLFPPAVAVPDSLRRPAFGLVRSDMWLQSINLGVHWTY